jgi:hypothetical protein
MQSFAEFWPFYVREHRLSRTRRLHFIGTTLALGVLVVAIAIRQWWLIAVVPICGYALAWYSHLVVEKNRPATFKYPLWSLAGDLKMWALMASGRMGAEVERIVGKEAARDASAN